MAVEVSNKDMDKDILTFGQLESGGAHGRNGTSEPDGKKQAEEGRDKGWLKRRAHVVLSPQLQLRRITVFTLHLQLVLMILSLAVFAAMYSQAFDGREVHYEYSSPLTAMWIGIQCTHFSAAYLIWWLLFCPSFTRAGHYFWAGSGALFAVLGFIVLISHASSKNEGSAAGCSILWIVAGATAFAASASWVREDLRSPLMRPPLWECGLACCCSLREWGIGFGLFVQLWFFIFGMGATIQAASAAADYSSYPPIGEVYDVRATPDVTVRMHMACAGPKGGGKTTFVMEHGGGANCLGLKAVADELAEKHGRRTCIYDRLGYGWTPSMYVRGKGQNFPTSGDLLKQLLAAKGETGPYTCVGHSAGGQACLRFALAMEGQVTGIAMLDGYPDLITAGAFRPGKEHRTAQSPALAGTRLFAILLGPTGLTRGLVGNPGPDFVPQSMASAMIALYGQTRFWLAQYTDLATAEEEGDAQFDWPRMGGSEDSRGIVTYGKTLGAHVLVMPADKTVNKVCSDTYKWSEFCCDPVNAANEPHCENNVKDSALYAEQAALYASSIGTSGALEVAPQGSGHAYPYLKDHYLWLVDRLLAHFGGSSA